MNTLKPHWQKCCLSTTHLLKLISVFKHFQRAGSAPTSDTIINAGNGFPSRDGQETNLAEMEHRQKGGNPNEC